MGDPVPSFDAAIEAVVAELSGLSPPLGAIYWFKNPLEDEEDFLEAHQDATSGDLDVFFVDGAARELEGRATGESYSIYDVQVRYHSVRLVDEWSAQARFVAERIKTELNKNAAIFAIGGQRQLQTAETAEVVSSDYVTVGEHRIYEIVVALSIEARRWT